MLPRKTLLLRQQAPSLLRLLLGASDGILLSSVPASFVHVILEYTDDKLDEQTRSHTHAIVRSFLGYRAASSFLDRILRQKAASKIYHLFFFIDHNTIVFLQPL